MKDVFFACAFSCGLAAFAAGCVTGDCPSEDPFPDESSCRQPDVRYEQPAQSVEAAYAVGQGIRIQAHVAGRVDVVPSDSDKVTVTYVPYAIGYAEQEAFARQQIDDFARVTAAVVGDEIVIESANAGGQSYLGADLTVMLPKTFAGSLFVEGGFDASYIDMVPPMIDIDLGDTIATETTASGEGIRLRGAAGLLNLEGFGRDVDVTVTSWGGASEGSITGDAITLNVPADIDGELILEADKIANSLQTTGVPETWLEQDEEDDISVRKTFTMGSGTGARVVVQGLGVVTLMVSL